MTPLLSIAGKFICSSAHMLFGRLGLHGLSLALGALVATVVIIWTPAIGIGPIRLWDGGYAARMEALRDENKRTSNDLSVCRGNVETLNASLDRQNLAVRALEVESARRISETREALTAANNAALRASERAEALRTRQIQGDNVCERLLDVDAAFMEMLE